MISRTALAVAALGIGALGFVGIGSYAGFTGQDTANANITAGTFDLQATAGTPTVTMLNGQSSLSPGSLTIADTGTRSNGTATTTLHYTLGAADPGHTYTIPFTVYDTGSLPGEIMQISFVPGAGSTTELASDLSISVNEQTSSGWTPIGAEVSGQGLVTSTPGSTDFIFANTPGGYHGLFNFVASNPGMSPNQPQGVGGGGLASQSYEIVEHFSNAHSTNTAEGESVSQAFTVTGNSV